MENNSDYSVADDIQEVVAIAVGVILGGIVLSLISNAVGG